jgi:hypothetical protein
MQFVVNGKMIESQSANKSGKDRSAVPTRLRSKSLIKLTDFAGATTVTPSVIRQLTLNEVQAEGGPAMVLLNNSRYENMPDMGMFGVTTEKPVEGTTEKWQLINLTMDAHPMHMHLVQFQLVSRQNFDAMAYMNDYMNSFTGVNGGMAGMYMGAEGPPNLYNVKNSDGAVGGNLPVTPYLLGAPIPADPNERGWKDVIKAYPGQVMTYMVRFAPTDLALGTRQSNLVYPFDPSVGPGYVWHCHIIEHEDNDMMRPMDVQRNPKRPVGPGPVIADSIALKGSLLGDNAAALNNQLETVALEQNYPNPFSTETEIKFRIPAETHIQLKLYNYLGVEVQTLIDAIAPAGNQTVRLSSANISSGIYYYQLKAGNYSLTKKLIVTR